MSRRSEIVIVGGGIVGLCVAALLSRSSSNRPRLTRHLKVTLVEAGKPPVKSDLPGLRVSALSPGSVATLRRIGAWSDEIAGSAAPIRDMRVWDSSTHVDSPDTLKFSAGEFGVPALGYIAGNSNVQCAILNALDKTDVQTSFETSVESMRDVGNRCELTLSSGKTLRPEVLIAADGARSLIRDQAGITVSARAYQQKAFVTHLQPTHAHGFTAWQRFLQQGPIGILPLIDERVSIVWSTTPDHADALLKMSDDELSLEVTAASSSVLGELRASGPRGAFPLRAQLADQFVRPGLALVGDAAHTIHPLAGQGVNLGIADAVRLADTILQSIEAGERPGDLPVLRRYERARKGDNQTMLRFTDRLNQLFASGSPAVTQLRRSGMNLFNLSGPIRRKAVQTALGLD